MKAMGRLQNLMRLQAVLAGSSLSTTRLAIVSSYDPKTYSAKVKIQPSDQETGWLPILAAWAGNGWGLFAPPPVGAQVEVLFQEGSIDVGIIQGVLYSEEDVPLSVEAGEYWLVHESGSYFKLTNDGKLLLHSTAEIDVGNLGSSLQTLLTHAFEALFNGHTHISASPGSPTSPPSQQLDDTYFTAVLKAN